MKLRARSGLKGILIPAIAALFLGFGIVGCSSTSDGAEPDAATTEEGAAASSSDPLANDANGSASAEGKDGDAAAADGAAPADGAVATADGAAPANNAAAGSELQNLVNDGSGNAAGAAPAADPGLDNAAGQDPFGATSANTSATPPADGAASADAAAAPVNPAADPFGPTATNTAPAAESAAAPSNPTAAAPAAPASGTEAAASEEGAAPAVAPASQASAGGAGSPGYVPENGAKMAYYIQKGDTLSVIAHKIYGNKGKWKQLQQENNLSDPNKIYAGDVVYYTLDNASKGFAEKYEGAAKQSVTVAKGDSLSSISAKVFGSQGSWRTLWKQNPQVKNPDVIKVGMVLSYTAAKSVATVEDGSMEATADNGQE